MVFGPPGLVGLHAARDVGEELLPGQDHAMLWFQAVGEPLVPATTEKIKAAMNNAAVRLILMKLIYILYFLSCGWRMGFLGILEQLSSCDIK